MSHRSDGRFGQASQAGTPAAGGSRPRIAIVPWGNQIEDYLDPIGITIDAFLEEMTGGWLFGYMAALSEHGVEPLLYCITRSVDRPEIRRHAPTGCDVRLMPVPGVYRSIARHLVNPYTSDPTGAFGRPLNRLQRVLARAAIEVAPYTAIDGRMLTQALAQDGCKAILVQEYEDPRFDRIVSVGRRLGLPVFATFQGGDSPFRRLERMTRRRALVHAAGLVIPSAREAARVRQLYGSPCPVLDAPNPLDLSLWSAEPRGPARAALGWRAEDRIAIFHGRIDIHRKGLDVLLGAWSRIARELDRPVRLMIVGDGQDHGAFRDLIESRNDDTVTWQAGYSLDRTLMRRMLSAADVAVTASRHEGFPVAPVEAMACGLPLVASDAPGLPEILAEGRDDGGILVRREDEEALAAALRELLGDPKLSDDYGLRARRTVERRFSYDVVGRRLADFFFPERTGKA